MNSATPGTRVNISHASSFTPTVCSNCALSLPSAVTTVHPSPSVRVRAVPSDAIGSIVKNIPGRSGVPRPGRPGPVPNGRRLMKLQSDAVRRVVVHHGVPRLLEVFPYRRRDVPDVTARAAPSHAQLEGFARDADESLRIRRRGGFAADEKRLGRVPVPAVHHRGDVDVDDVPGGEDLRYARHAVAHHLVDGDAR